MFLSSWVSATAGAEGGWIHRCEVIGGRILKAMTTTSYWPFEEGKLPHMSDFPRVIEVEPSSKIKIHMIKKFLNSILYWYLTAAKSFEVSKNNRPVPILHILRFGALLYDEEENNVFWVHQKFIDSRKIKSRDFFLVKSLVLYLILLEIRIFFHEK